MKKKGRVFVRTRWERESDHKSVMGTLLAKNDGEGRELTYVATTTKRQSLKMENAKNRMRKRERESVAKRTLRIGIEQEKLWWQMCLRAHMLLCVCLVMYIYWRMCMHACLYGKWNSSLFTVHRIAAKHQAMLKEREREMSCCWEVKEGNRHTKRKREGQQLLSSNK